MEEAKCLAAVEMREERAEARGEGEMREKAKARSVVREMRGRDGGRGKETVERVSETLKAEGDGGGKETLTDGRREGEEGRRLRRVEGGGK